MDKMMVGMNIKPTGDVDHDFTVMMIPHHRGAIDMAQAELQYGRNQKLVRIALNGFVKSSPTPPLTLCVCGTAYAHAFLVPTIFSMLHRRHKLRLA
jgi:Domain of unknown function (DUF305)